jgi:ABC-2 type transport system permease protein
MEEEKLRMHRQIIHKNMKLKSWIQFLITALAAIIAVWISSFFSLRLDLTEDRRYTLSGPGREVLSGLKNDVYIQVYLDGDMNIAFKRLKRSVKEILDEFRIASGRKVDYEFINPFEGKDANQKKNQYQALLKKGLNPVDIKSKDEEGGSSQKIVFPGLIINYNGIEIPVNFLRNNIANSPEQNILHSVEGLEYELIQALATVCSDTIRKVAFIEGQNEIPEIGVADLTLELAKFFTVDRGVIGGKPGILDKYAAIIIAGPENSFDEKDKLIIDQYIMNGGKVMWLIEEVKVNSDSLYSGETVAMFRPLNIEDQLFKYGARVNPSIVQDIDCMVIPMKIVSGSAQSQIVPVPWIYYPLLHPATDHPITRNLNKVKGEFINYLDTVGLDPKVRKKILLTTSGYSKIINPPVIISLNEADRTPDKREFNRSSLPVALLLEGQFTSSYKNRMIIDLVKDNNFKLITESRKTKMIVIADGDIIRNKVRRVGSTETPLPLDKDLYTPQLFGNKDFLVNCLNYLVDNNGIMELRSRELKLRLLDRNRTRQDRLEIQLINILTPLIIVILAGLIYNYIRKRIYTKY